jgi:hypothetical protein
MIPISVLMISCNIGYDIRNFDIGNDGKTTISGDPLSVYDPDMRVGFTCIRYRVYPISGIIRYRVYSISGFIFPDIGVHPRYSPISEFTRY